jgi:hypothetical protein
MSTETATRTVTLQFPTVYSLWAFAKTLSSNNIEINTNQKTLTCDCLQDHIADAISTYQARLLDNQ